MGQHYIISDAAKKLDVDAHVLRYWEEELGLMIQRNEYGHRIYHEEDLLLLSAVKELKEKGIQLRAIKAALPEIQKKSEDCLEKMMHVQEANLMNADDMKTNEPFVQNEQKDSTKCMQVLNKNNEEGSHSYAVVDTENKMHQFELILKNIVSEVLHENNSDLGKEVSSRVTDSVIKEMDYLFRLQDEREDERYKKMDEVIRHYQKRRREVASTSEQNKKKKEGIFKKKRISAQSV